MAKTLLSIQDLQARALAEIRQLPGCHNVQDIAINRVKDERAENNWSLCVLSAGAADANTAARATVILDLLEGQYKNPVRVVAFNTAEKWSQDVSADVAHELLQRCNMQLRDVPFFLQDFVDRYEGRYHDVQLPLPMRLA
jgi:hypothetical protein